MAKKKAREIRAEILFDLLANSPDGMTAEDICYAEDWSGAQFRAALQWLRDNLGTGDTLTVIAEPNGFREPWLYRLIDGGQVVDGEASRWVNNRTNDLDRRLLTLMSVLATAVRSTDGRSAKGRKARALQVHMTRALEDIRMIDADGGPPALF
jgi:hypothetical protein